MLMTTLQAKVERARDRVGAIEAHLKAWPQDDTHGIGLETRYDEAASELVFVVRVPPPPDLILSSLVGEALHHLRSSLDHLVYALVVAHTRREPDFNSAFPIVGRGKKAKAKWRTAAGLFEHQTSRLKRAISPTALARIRTLQPFHRGAAFDTHPLWLLNELNNADKHRSPIVAQTFVGFGRGGKASFKFANGPQTGRGLGRAWLNFGAQLTPGTELARFSTMKPTRQVGLAGYLSVAPAIKIHSNGRHEKATVFLRNLADYVEQTIGHFAEEFSASTRTPASQTEETGLSVSPTSLILSEDGRRHEAHFEVVNLSHEHRYAVCVQVIASEVGAPSQHIAILPDEDPFAPRVMAGPIEVSLDALILDIQDDHGNTSSVIGFYELAPGARRRVKLGAKDGVDRTLSAAVAVVAFSTEPPPIVSTGDQPQFGFKVPVRGTLLALHSRQRQVTGGAGTLRMRVKEA